MPIRSQTARLALHQSLSPDSAQEQGSYLPRHLTKTDKLLNRLHSEAKDQADFLEKRRDTTAVIGTLGGAFAGNRLGNKALKGLLREGSSKVARLGRASGYAGIGVATVLGALAGRGLPKVLGIRRKIEDNQDDLEELRRLQGEFVDSRRFQASLSRGLLRDKNEFTQNTQGVLPQGQDDLMKSSAAMHPYFQPRYVEKTAKDKSFEKRVLTTGAAFSGFSAGEMAQDALFPYIRGHLNKSKPLSKLGDWRRVRRPLFVRDADTAIGRFGQRTGRRARRGLRRLSGETTGRILTRFGRGIIPVGAAAGASVLAHSLTRNMD